MVLKLLNLCKSLGTLLLLLIMFPFATSVVFIALILRFFSSPSKNHPSSNTETKNILITGGKMTKALQLARSFAADGHRVILVETHKYWLSGHRFSQAVSKFLTVPAPEKDPQGYAEALLEIVKKENIDIFIPVASPVASYYDSLAKPLLSPYCEVLHFDAEITKILDNKYTFAELASSLGLTAPKTFLITDIKEILDFNFDGSQYILKSIRYNSLSRLDMTKLPFVGMENYLKTLPINQENPWIMQEFIKGKEYCTHSTVRQGKIRLHCCSESSAFQVNYEHIEHPVILEWVKDFVEKLNLTGQISFDFIEAENGQVYAIECNPRTHSAITMFYNHPEVANAYLQDDHQEKPIFPLAESKPTYWLYHELWRLTQGKNLTGRIKPIIQGKDAIFQLNDPVPFLAVHHWQIPLLILNNLLKLKGWYRIDFNIGKLIEIGGD